MMNYSGFTETETRIINLLVNRTTIKEIGKKLFVRPDTISSHLLNIRRKLDVRSTSEVIIYFLQNNIVPENVFTFNDKVKCELTHREKEVLDLAAKGKTSKEISEKLFIGLSTVNSYRRSLLQKVEVSYMNEIIILYIRGLLEITLPNDDEFEVGLERPYNLTKRQFQILGKLVSGLSSVQISTALDLSIHSIEAHKGRIFKKLGVNSSKEAILKAMNENFYVLQIVREIEFDEHHFKAGMSILSHFGTVLKQKNPENTASVKIEQDGYKIRMIIDYKDGNEKEIIEKTLFDYGQLILGNINAQDFFPELDQVIQFEAELQLASVRFELEKKRIQAKKKIKKLNKEIKSQNEIINNITAQRDELRRVIGDVFSKSFKMQNVENRDSETSPLSNGKSIFSNPIFFEEAEVKELIYLYRKTDFTQLLKRMESLLEEKSKSGEESEKLSSLMTHLNQIYAQYNSYKSESLKGTLNITDKQVLLNQISNNILELINTLKVKKNS